LVTLGSGEFFDPTQTRLRDPIPFLYRLNEIGGRPHQIQFKYDLRVKPGLESDGMGLLCLFSRGTGLRIKMAVSV
jgi:hypothetical protein